VSALQYRAAWGCKGDKSYVIPATARPLSLFCTKNTISSRQSPLRGSRPAIPSRSTLPLRPSSEFPTMIQWPTRLTMTDCSSLHNQKWNKPLCTKTAADVKIHKPTRHHSSPLVGLLPHLYAHRAVFHPFRIPYHLLNLQQHRIASLPSLGAVAYSNA
jgi:hypothetical protein